jgi:hypothetical protein
MHEFCRVATIWLKVSQLSARCLNRCDVMTPRILAALPTHQPAKIYACGRRCFHIR